MTSYHVIVEGDEDRFTYTFNGEPQINLTFEHSGTTYDVVTRAHDEDAETPTLHTRIV